MIYIMRFQVSNNMLKQFKTNFMKANSGKFKFMVPGVNNISTLTFIRYR